MVLLHKNIPVGPDYYKMELIAPEIVLAGKPGQFVHLKVNSDNSYDPLLRRPFSIHNIDQKYGLLSLIYRVAGKGTTRMSKFIENKEIDLLGPLGTGFKTDFKNKNILIIGGGMGIVPLYYLSKVLDGNNNILVLLGGNSAAEIDYFYNIFTDLSLEVKLATIDGGRGYQGTVVDLWENISQGEQKDPDFIYTCGPEAMLKTVQQMAREKGIPGQLLLEKRMGCGIGVCLSCVCKTVNGNKRVCREGPVFSLAEVIFDE